jgi:O-antigen/teichoic acid export membrane protein
LPWHGRKADLTLLRNSLAFSAGTVVRMSLGFFTWLAAARLYAPSQVGAAATAIAAMMLCIEAGLLGVDLALVAIFPAHRKRPAPLINNAITLAGITAGVGSLLFVALAAADFRALHLLVANPGNAALFISLTVLGAAWWLMDQTAVSLRRSDQVLVRALVAGPVTLVGVAALGAAGYATASAILVAWLVAAVAACAIGLVQIGRVVGGFRLRPRLRKSLSRRLVSAGLPNFALSAADNAPGLILPIIAAQVISPRAAAFWYVVWMMALAAYMVPASFGLHLFAEISDQPSELATHSRYQLRSGVLFAAAATIGLITVGPFVLSALGPAYASHGTTPLRIAALAAVPMVVMKSYLFTCRATSRIREGTIAAAISGVIAVGLAIAGARSLGLPGMAAAWLAVQSVAALWAGFRLRTLTSAVAAETEAGGAVLAAPEAALLR